MPKKEPRELKIMVVDDSDFIRRKIVDLLEKNNLKVVAESPSAKKALELHRKIKPNVIITDIVMPEISGLELAKHVNDNPMADPTYVIAMSSLSTEDLVVEAISSGAVDFLAKPFKDRDLVRSVLKIKDILDGEAR